MVVVVGGSSPEILSVTYRSADKQLSIFEKIHKFRVPPFHSPTVRVLVNYIFLLHSWVLGSLTWGGIIIIIYYTSYKIFNKTISLLHTCL